MSGSTSSLGDFYSRRLLVHHLPLNNLRPSSVAPSPSVSGHESSSDTYLDENGSSRSVCMIILVIFGAQIVSLVLHFIIRSIMRYCSNVVASYSNGNAPTRLANKGISKKALKTFPIISYSTELKLPGLDTECAICLSEFASGERIRLLPKCGHGFHAKCIDKWLSSNSSCPKCRQCLTDTSEKILGGSQVVAPMQEIVVVSIAPIEPESLMCSNREN